MTEHPATLTVVSVLYRSAPMLAQTLPTWIQAARGLPIHFVFVDNSPTDGCDALLSASIDADRLTYVANPANNGFAGGCNLAIESVVGRHVLLLNADVWLPPDALAQIVEAIAGTPDQPIAVGLAMDGGEYTGIDVSPIGLFVDRPSTAGRGPLGPSGGAAVFPVDLIRRFQGFDEGMFAWGEDADLAFRLYAAGVRTATLNLGLPHAKGHSVDGDAKLSELRAFLLARNRVLVAARTFSWPLLLVGLPFAMVAHAALAVRRIRQGLLRPFLRGVARGILDAPGRRRAATGPRFTLANLIGYLRGGRSDERQR